MGYRALGDLLAFWPYNLLDLLPSQPLDHSTMCPCVISSGAVVRATMRSTLRSLCSLCGLCTRRTAIGALHLLHLSDASRGCHPSAKLAAQRIPSPCRSTNGATMGSGLWAVLPYGQAHSKLAHNLPYKRASPLAPWLWGFGRYRSPF